MRLALVFGFLGWARPADSRRGGGRRWCLAFGAVCAAIALVTPALADSAYDSVDLSAEQAKQITIGTVGYRDFPQDQSAVGSVDFDEDMESQIFPPYQGKILTIEARIGDTVRRAQILFTIDSPDLLQAESNLISADATLTQSNRALARARDLYRKNGMAEKDYDQAVNDQQTAEGAYRAARDAVQIFGKTEAEIDLIVHSRKPDPSLIVRSPINGLVVARSAAPGVFVQPGNTPAPLTIADNALMWLIANVGEGQSALISPGQPVIAQVQALPGRSFSGRVAAVGAIVDPNTRRFVVRTEIADPDHVLRSGMFADFTITTGAPIHALAMPMNGVVREGDGTQSVWVTTDRRHFLRKTVTIGLASNGYRQITGGLGEGETVVTDGAVFLSNMLQADPT
jgi:cobalt-zinc-cadmium efflux system membrane fusion protein